VVAVPVEVAVPESELVSDAISDESDDWSLPVAVESTDESDDSELLTRLDDTEDRLELSDDSTELLTDDALDDAEESGLVEVVVKVLVPVELPDVEVVVLVSVVWAAAREASARAATAKRILAMCLGVVRWKRRLELRR